MVVCTVVYRIWTVLIGAFDFRVLYIWMNVFIAGRLMLNRQAKQMNAIGTT